MAQRIIFVCTSNTCRSPMAEAFAKKWVAESGLSDKYSISSRALTEDYEPEDSPASLNGIAVLRDEYGIDNSPHRSKLLTSSDCEEAVAIVGVSKSHARVILEAFPETKSKVSALSSDVSDPWHQSLEVYAGCARKMKPLVEEAMDRIHRATSASC